MAVTLAALVPMMNSCVFRRIFREKAEYRPLHIKRSDYPVLPGSKLGDEMRARSIADPEYAEKFFWGRYGGPGNEGGPPVDAMDVLFYWHDVAYLDGVSLWELRKADWKLIRELKRLDMDELGSGARGYRRRAIFYFRLPISWWVGKPDDVRDGTKSGPAVIWVGEAETPGGQRDTPAAPLAR